jgi:hypothetical protein
LKTRFITVWLLPSCDAVRCANHGARFADTTAAARERAIALSAMTAVGRAARLAAPVSCAAAA